MGQVMCVGCTCTVLCCRSSLQKRVRDSAHGCLLTEALIQAAAAARVCMMQSLIELVLAAVPVLLALTQDGHPSKARVPLQWAAGSWS
jgi:hypothetical protein